MTHLWVRAESRDNEERVGILPDGVAALLAQGMEVTVEDSLTRVIPTADYAATGATIAAEGSWENAPTDAIIFGLKELPDNDTPLRHSHIMFGHAYKGQPAGQRLLARFKRGGGTLYDLEYLEDPDGRRVAAFGYWAGYAGAAVSLLAFAAQGIGPCPSVTTWPSSEAMRDDVRTALNGATPNALVIGALGRVGTGATDLCEALGLAVTKWDMDETAHGGPFPEVLDHKLFFNCILARPGTPVFVPADACTRPRKLRVIGDIACDPDSDFSPIKVYDRVTSWAEPVVRACEDPPLDVMAIDNLPSLLPKESSDDFAAQLLPHLKTLDALDSSVWGRAKRYFDDHIQKVTI
ncbi:saccharopine dehydrogenase [Marivita hallyeonensis]|uniref:Saccharopine dehydrogenase [NAD(+), L-lysine-forming] n=1 Tax=Marivita hallyeonensis TaxID=996342 RepID=A0A1M5VLQ8_9RHOB|nr:saccharopine dehydrogenase [Marivita hallyeonensis]SHH75843.1 saccharopine dehydrogenase (NAD+, L-lysine-forming) [Marivita hallyeonensis]